MSRYARLHKLLEEDSSIDLLSFYPDYLLNLRSILSEWVEQQDWSGVLCEKEDSEAQAQQSKRLLDDALALLKNKSRNDNKVTTGFEFHIKNTETQLKKAYEEKPIRFVQDLCNCLDKEDQLTSKMMSQMQAASMDSSPSYQHIPAEDLNCRITQCQALEEKIIELARASSLLLAQWHKEVQAKSTVSTDVFGNGKLNQPPYQVFMSIKQNLESHILTLLKELDTVLSGLQWHVTQWKTHQLHTCVSRKPEGSQGEELSYVEHMCERVCQCVNSLLQCAESREFQQMDLMRSQTSASLPTIPTPSIISALSLNLKQIVQRLLDMLLVVIEQPDLTMMIEKEKKDKEDVNNSKKFRTTIGILGGKGFGDTMEIMEVKIYLAFNRDLPEARMQKRSPSHAFKIYHDKPGKQRRSSKNLESPMLPYQRTYEDLRVEHFSRKETKHVYKQLYHVVYDVKLYISHLLQEEYHGQIISLPIIIRTGANQASEHIGAQLWHSFSCPNMYDPRAEMALSMKVEDVIQMMNERILFIGGRGLKQYERDFLRERLTMAASGKGDKNSDHATISVDAFIKDKVVLPKHGASGTGGETDIMTFSLWRWLHSIINLLVDTLKAPWLDGIIYGFASREHCIKVLRDQSDGMFLLRFSESFLSSNYSNSKGALAVVLKSSGQVAFAPPINSDEIEKEGLAHMIETIGCQQLLDTPLNINDLHQKYPPSPSETGHSDRYIGFTKKEVIVQHDSDFNSIGSPCFIQMGSPPHAGASMPISDRKHKKGKRRNQKPHPQETSMSTTKLHCPAPPESPESTTSSVPSPTIMPAGSEQLFKPVGLRVQSQKSWGSGPPSNIPTTVLGEDQVGTDEMLMGSPAFFGQVSRTQGDTMEFELPPGQELPPGEYHVIITSTEATMPMQGPSSMTITSPNFLLSNNQDAGLLTSEEGEQFSPDDVEALTDILGNITSHDLT